jgi:S-DNA-T family DNA segregation ATPase FtsK/SpoIIIE
MLHLVKEGDFFYNKGYFMGLFSFGSRRSRRASAEGWLKPETKRAIVGIILFIAALVSVLSFFSLAGPTGEMLLGALKVGFGWMGYLVPVVGFLVALELIWPGFLAVERGRWVGVALLMVGLLGVSHLLGGSLTDSLQVAHDGRGGGYSGFFLSYPLSLALSPLAAGAIFVGVLLTGAFLTFNVSPVDIWYGLMYFWPGRRTDGEEGEETDEDSPRFKVNTMMTGAARPPDVVRLKMQQQQEEQQKAKTKQLLKSVNRAYNPPSVDLLHSAIGRPDSGNIKENAAKIKRTLENFGITVTMGEVNVGPTVTQYTLRPEEGIKLSRITALQNDLALALAAHPIRIEAPIPRKNLVGIEVPNREVSLVRLRDLLVSKEFKQAESPLSIALGKDVAGATVVETLDRMPHLLIAGATGSGKSVSINTILLSLLYRNSPAIMKLILVDPKRVELNVYDGIPHLLTPVIVDPSKTINALKWAVREMDRRYQVLSEAHARNLLSFNTNNPDEALPLILIVIDELADLMAKYARDVEGAIVRLSQMARAVGIHLVLATQRPSVNVITGLIKANIPTRVAFHVASQVDSRTILDIAGAEKLLGNGDMLYLSSELGKPRRLQGAFVSDEEVQRVVEAVKENNPESEPMYDTSIVAVTRDTSTLSSEGADDTLFEEAKRVVVESGKASASLLQRRLRVGYARAARLLDMLQEQNIIGSGDGNKPREVLLRPDTGSVETDDMRYASQQEDTTVETDDTAEPDEYKESW